MGISSDAMLCYGVQIPEGEDPWGENSDGDWDEWLRDQCGAPPSLPWAKEEDDPETHRKWVGRLNERRAFDDSILVDISSHCSDGYGMYTLIVRGTERRASRGYPERIDAASLAIKEDWDSILRSACKQLGIKWSEPAWWLQSWMG